MTGLVGIAHPPTWRFRQKPPLSRLLVLRLVLLLVLLLDLFILFILLVLFILLKRDLLSERRTILYKRLDIKQRDGKEDNFDYPESTDSSNLYEMDDDTIIE